MQQQKSKDQKKYVLALSHVDVYVSDKHILHDISYNFHKNKMYAIMGPNGCGKSTLAHVVMGSPAYTLSKRSKIILNNKDITNISVDKRSKAGIFLSYQTPISLSGVTVFNLLRESLLDKKNNIKDLEEKIQRYANMLKIDEDLLNRSLNEGASGGERKKLELLQSAVIDREVIILDEIDTGVDVDALKDIAEFINKHRKNKTYIIITHYNRILDYVKPDEVLIMYNGQIVKSDGPQLAQQIEKVGYATFLPK